MSEWKSVNYQFAVKNHIKSSSSSADRCQVKYCIKQIELKALQLLLPNAYPICIDRYEHIKNMLYTSGPRDTYTYFSYYAHHREKTMKNQFILQESY